MKYKKLLKKYKTTESIIVNTFDKPFTIEFTKLLIPRSMWIAFPPEMKSSVEELIKGVNCTNPIHFRGILKAYRDKSLTFKQAREMLKKCD